jgi:hypothetical protein
MSKLTLNAVLPGTQTVNFTELGTVDWYGFPVTHIPNRKVGANIINFAFPGNIQSFQAAEVPLIEWSDGTPTLNASFRGGFEAGRVTGEGGTIIVPAGIAEQVLEVFTGMYGGKLKFTATLSDNSSPAVVDTTTVNWGGGGPVNGRFTLNFAAASEGQTLTVRLLA